MEKSKNAFWKALKFIGPLIMLAAAFSCICFLPFHGNVLFAKGLAGIFLGFSLIAFSEWNLKLKTGKATSIIGWVIVVLSVGWSALITLLYAYQK